MAKAEGPRNLESSEASLEVLRVLVVEKEGSARFLWESLLTRAHSRIVIRWADSAAEAESIISKAREQKRAFRLVISDLNPDDKLNALDLWKRFKDNGESFLITSAIAPADYKVLATVETNLPVFAAKRPGFTNLLPVIQRLIKKD